MNHPNNTLNKRYRPPIHKLFGWQLVIIVVLVLLIAVFDRVAAYSTLLGGLIYSLPTAYFALKVFRYSGARLAPQVTQSFYRAEAGKFVLTLVLFAMVFTLVKPLNVVAFFLAFALTAIVHSTLVFIIKR